MKEAGGGLIQTNLTNESSLVGGYQDSLILLGVPPEDARNNASHLGCAINQRITGKNKEHLIKGMEQLVGSIKKGVAIVEKIDPHAETINYRDKEIRKHLGTLSDYGVKVLLISSTTAEQLNSLTGEPNVLVSDLIQPSQNSRKGISFYGAAELSRMTGCSISLALAMNAAIGVIIDINFGATKAKESANIAKKLIQATNLLAEPVFDISEKMKGINSKGVIHEVRNRTARFFSQGNG